MASDRYNLNVECPNCGKSGKAGVRENDGYSFMNSGSQRNVSSVSEGFTVVNHGRERIEEMAIRCECGTAAAISLS